MPWMGLAWGWWAIIGVVLVFLAFLFVGRPERGVRLPSEELEASSQTCHDLETLEEAFATGRISPQEYERQRALIERNRAA